jgi:two-component system sensor histidine kinase UhpB
MPSNEQNIEILLVEDNPADVFLLKEMLVDSQVYVQKLHVADRVSAASKCLSENKVTTVLLDLSLPGSQGLETYRQLQPVTKNIPVIILTGLNDSYVALEAIREGAQDYLVKGEFTAALLSRTLLYSLERKKAEESLAKSEENFREMFYGSPYPSWICDDTTQKFLEVNEAAIRLYGYERKEFMDLTLPDLFQPGENPFANGSFLGIFTGVLTRQKTKAGNEILLELNAHHTRIHDRSGWQVQMNDQTEKLGLQKKLEQQRLSEQKRITSAVLFAQEKERKYLGEELHDNINQVLATAKLYLEYARSNPPSRDELIDKSISVIMLAIDEIRKLSHHLIVNDISLSKENGLMHAIQDVAAGLREVGSIRFITEMKEFDEKGLDNGCKIAIYRIIQEQLNNIIKHAEASEVIISLAKRQKKVTLVISDNGKGFEPSAQKYGVGLTNIRSRVSLYDGEFVIRTAPGEGCSLEISLQT